jgi:hypothetical protein
VRGPFTAESNRLSVINNFIVHLKRFNKYLIVIDHILHELFLLSTLFIIIFGHFEPMGFCFRLRHCAITIKLGLHFDFSKFMVYRNDRSESLNTVRKALGQPYGSYYII